MRNLARLPVPWNHANITAHMPAILKSVRIINNCCNRFGESRVDSGDCSETFHFFIRFAKGVKFGLQYLELFLGYDSDNGNPEFGPADEKISKKPHVLDTEGGAMLQ